MVYCVPFAVLFQLLFLDKLTQTWFESDFMYMKGHDERKSSSHMRSVDPLYCQHNVPPLGQCLRFPSTVSPHGAPSNSP